MSAAVRTFSQYTSTIYPGNKGASPNTDPTKYVPFSEIQYGKSGGPEESFGDNGHAKRVLRCRWQDRMTLIWQLLGGPIILGNPGVPTAAQASTKWSGSWSPAGSASTGDILVLSPHMYPYNTALYCSNVSVTPEGSPIKGGVLDSRIDNSLVPSDTISNFDHAILACDYISPPTTTGQSTGYSMFFKEQLSPSTEFITLPRNNLYWDNAASVPANTNEAPACEIKRWIWTVTRRKCVIGGPLLSLIPAYQGCVNTGAMASLYCGGTIGPISQVLFEGATFEPDSLNDGTPAVKAEMKFRISTVDWNKFPHVMGSGAGTQLAFDPLYLPDGTQFKLFPTAALQNLISSSYW
jgi:hypothetical protein